MKLARTERPSMRYPAIVTKEGKFTLAEFPDCPGCQTFVEAVGSIATRAAEALEGWLETSLEFGDAPERPSKRTSAPKGGAVLWVPVPPKLAAALEIRWARRAAHLSQTELGKLVGVTQQQIAKLERATGNLSLETLEKVAHALGRTVLASDRALVEEMTAAGGNATFSDLAIKIVSSRQFRNRQGQDDVPPGPRPQPADGVAGVNHTSQ